MRSKYVPFFEPHASVLLNVSKGKETGAKLFRELNGDVECR